MYCKGLNVFVLVVSVTLVLPSSLSPTAAKQNGRRKDGNAQVDNGWTHRDQLALSPLHGLDLSSMEYNKESTRPLAKDAGTKETPLIRLKRIKREMEEAASRNMRLFSNDVNSGAASNREASAVIPRGRSPMIDSRHPTGRPVSDEKLGHGLPPVNSGLPRADLASRVHKELLQRMEEENRKISHRGKERAPGKIKTNDIAERTQNGGRIQNGGRAQNGGRVQNGGHGGGGGAYIHHKLERDRLESAVESSERQRTHKKNKHQRNKSELGLKGTSGKGHAVISRPRQLAPTARLSSEERAGRIHVRGRPRPRTDIKGAGEAKRRTRRGQRTEVGSKKVEGQGQNVRMELEQIKRMQRDLMREITHLERMKKKKKKRQTRTAPSQANREKMSVRKRK